MIKKILNYTFFLICLFTMLTYDVNALQTEPSSVQFLDNYGSSLSIVSTELVDNTYYGYFGLTAGTTGGAVAIRLNENIAEYHMYSLTLNVGVPAGGYTTASSKNIVGIGSNLTNAMNSYINANNSIVNYTQGGTSDSPYYLSIIFTSYSNGSYIVVPYNVSTTCTGSCENFFKGYTLTDLGSSENLSDTEVNNIINNQTYVIQESINNIENNINNTITDMEDNINNTITDMEDSINNKLEDNLSDCDFVNLLKNINWISGKRFNTDGTLIDSTDHYYFTDYIDISKATELTISNSKYPHHFENNAIILYDSNKNVYDYWTAGDRVIDVSNVSYFRISVRSDNRDIIITDNVTKECSSKIDKTNEKLDQTNQQLGDLNNSLNDSNTSDATNEAGNFFSGFETDTFGLTSIITAPLNLIGSITSSSCSPLGLQVPFVKNTTLNLPCMTTIYENYFGSFLSVYQTITFGIVAYWVCVRIFALVKDFKNPDHDEIEVLDL